MSWSLLSARLPGDGAAVLTAHSHSVPLRLNDAYAHLVCHAEIAYSKSLASVPEMCTIHSEDPTRALAARAGEEIALEYNQPALPVPGQPDTEPILRVASIMQVRWRVWV